MGSFSLVHWLVLGLVVVLLFGGSRLGAVGKGLGEGIRNFKKGISSDDDEDEDDKDTAEKDTAEAKQLKKGSKASDDDASESKTKAKKG